MLGPMGSNLQRVLGLMTPESVNAIVEHARHQNREDILATDTSIDAEKKDEYKYEKNENDSQGQEPDSEKESKEHGAILKFQTTKNASDKKNTKEAILSNIEDNIIQFDKTKVNETTKRAKQKSAIASYQRNIVPNYLKGTVRNDLQGLLINKKCG